MFDSRTSWSFAKHEPAESIHGIREKPHGSLDMVQRPLNRCREKRLLNTLNRHTSEQVSSNEKQGCQDWGFDFHEIHAIFLLLSIGGVTASRMPNTSALAGTRQPRESGNFSDSAGLLMRIVTNKRCRSIGTRRNIVWLKRWRGRRFFTSGHKTFR
jgi:hypothetical protein